MPRIFLALVLANAILFSGAAILGLFADPPTCDRHVILGVLSLLLGALIQVVAFMYLVVGGRIARQAAYLAGLDGGAAERASVRKARLVPLIGLIVVGLVAVVATGSSAWRQAGAGWLHAPAVGLLLVLQAWVWMREHELLCAFRADLAAVLRKRHDARED